VDFQILIKLIHARVQKLRIKKNKLKKKILIFQRHMIGERLSLNVFRRYNQLEQAKIVLHLMQWLP
jgi:hypothetical protein